MRAYLTRSTLWTVAVCLLLGVAACQERRGPQPPREGLALAIVYDTSGSMADNVPSASGAPEAKYLIARRAMGAILDLLADYASATGTGTPRVVEAELITMDGARIRTPIEMQRFDARQFKDWINALDEPSGGTPLGVAVREASLDLLDSPMTRKHVLVLTDGENTEGPEPQGVIPGMKTRAGEAGTGLQFHFVAFDVAAERFTPIKDLGATVVSANDETQLKDQLEFILQKKILLENEE